MLEIIYEAYPELKDADLRGLGINLQDDLDGKGPYIREWNYSKPVPTSLQQYVR